MGMAHHAPMDSYRRRFVISNAALERTREFMSEQKRALHYGGAALGNALDAAIHGAISVEKYEHFTDDVKKAMLVDLSDTEFDGLFAILHDDTTQKLAKQMKVCVTMLSREQVAKNKANPNWRWDHKGLPGKGMVSMKDKLQPVLLRTIDEAATKTPDIVAAPKQAAPAAVPEARSSEGLLQQFEKYRLVSWPDADDNELQQLFTSPAEAADFVAHLIEDEGYDTEEIRIFKPSWTEAKKKVKVELE